MGIYVDIRSKKYGHAIATGKYGVGYAILMFSRFERKNNQFFFIANGDEAISNLDKYLTYIQANISNKNEDNLLKIEDAIHRVRSKLRTDDFYYLDYSEIMDCVHNPNYDPMRPVTETAEKIDDAIFGYNRFGDKDTVAIKIMLAYLKSINPQVYVSSVVREMKQSFVFTANICGNADDKRHLETILLRTSDDIDWQINEYYQRKLFMTLKKAGLEFEYLKAEANSAYIIIDKDYMQKLVDTKPFVVVSYRWNTTCDIYHLLPNNPDEKEKLYSYLKAQDTATRNLESLVIDGTELVNLSTDDVSTQIGKSVTLTSYNYSDVALFDL